jgi:hypothetical protein
MSIHRKLVTLSTASCATVAIGTMFAQGDDGPAKGPFQFQPLTASAPCTAGQPDNNQFLLPPGYVQTVIAREGDGGSTDEWDQNTLNESGRTPDVSCIAHTKRPPTAR